MQYWNWLENWYSSHCNGEWEECYGIKIQTLDNPGWFVEIELSETPLATKSFTPINIENSEEDWVICKVENERFYGFGDPNKLSYIISIFKEWNEAIENQL